MPFISHIGATRVVILCTALALGRSALSQVQPDIKSQRASVAEMQSDDVGRALLDSFGPAEVTQDDSGYVKSATTASPAEFMVPTAYEVPFNRFQSAPFDRSGSAVFQNPRGRDATGSANGADTGYPTLNWSGFLQVDTGWIYQDRENKTTVGEVTLSTGLRRVRLRADGNIQEATSYVIDLDFAASGHPSFRNVGLTFHDVPVLQDLELGLLKTPFGMDAMTSGRELMFMERQMPFALVPFRQVMIGARGSSEDKTVSWGGAVYRMPTDSFGVYEGGSGGIAVAGRVTTALFYKDDGATVLHIGGGYSVGSPGNGVVRYRIQPGFFTHDQGTDGNDPGTVPVFLDTGNIQASTFNLFNLEAGMNLGAVHIVAEMRWAMVNQNTGPSVTFPGFYVQASYVLTGENHRYSRERAVFQRVIPKRPFERGKRTGFGAWEAALGYSMLDLNQKNIAGGRGEELALGLNWYLTRNAKLQLNVLPGTLRSCATISYRNQTFARGCIS
jgi:phosphate-selective porin